MDTLHIILDNGHGNDTPGKCSPDKRLMEWAYSREIVKMIAKELDKYNEFTTHIIVPEDNDITLKERCIRTNDICKKYGNDHCIFLSIHCNAAGCGGWMSAQGWSAWIYRGAKDKTKLLANLLFDACALLGLKTRKPLPNQKYWDCGFYVCRYTNCPAVLTENFFQDNKQDVEFLLSDKGKTFVTHIHTDAIVSYYSSAFGTTPTLRAQSATYEGCIYK